MIDYEEFCAGFRDGLCRVPRSEEMAPSYVRWLREAEADGDSEFAGYLAGRLERLRLEEKEGPRK